MTSSRGGRRPGTGRAPRFDALEDRRLMAVSLAFDYSLDSMGFFTAERRALLESATGAIAARLGDSLQAVPTTSYTLPTAAGTRTFQAAVPADVIRVYAFGDSLSDGSIAQGARSTPPAGRAAPCAGRGPTTSRRTSPT